ncbi:hypothetical protein BMETH_1636_0 [methanotrophic bacterial endosymbiont of Bathymodiolus sp.]|jgi:hypothetical protein|nr:hypothetical protein BMETH_1636_0 [methanotrophic bacterial endosymbiont of Bathymodiolus sp.]
MAIDLDEALVKEFLITLGYDVLGSQAQENLDFNKSSSIILSSFTAIIMA